MPSRPTKAQRNYFHRQLEIRDEELESGPDPENCDCKIWKWMNGVDPHNGLGPCPCPTIKRVLIAPHFSSIFSEAHAVLSLPGLRRRKRTLESTTPSSASVSTSSSVKGCELARMSTFRPEGSAPVLSRTSTGILSSLGSR